MVHVAAMIVISDMVRTRRACQHDTGNNSTPQTQDVTPGKPVVSVTPSAGRKRKRNTVSVDTEDDVQSSVYFTDTDQRVRRKRLKLGTGGDDSSPRTATTHKPRKEKGKGIAVRADGDKQQNYDSKVQPQIGHRGDGSHGDDIPDGSDDEFAPAVVQMRSPKAPQKRKVKAGGKGQVKHVKGGQTSKPQVEPTTNTVSDTQEVPAVPHYIPGSDSTSDSFQDTDDVRTVLMKFEGQLQERSHGPVLTGNSGVGRRDTVKTEGGAKEDTGGDCSESDSDWEEVGGMY